MQNTKLTQAFAGVFSLSTLKQLLVMFAVIGMGLLLIGHVPHADAAVSKLIQPGDNPENISDATGAEGSARALARTIVNFFLFFLGLVATIMVIYGGVMYVTAAGNDDQVGKAKNVILYAIVGIVVILLSFALINTIIGGAGTADEPTTTGGGV